jgi:hypothetical protein
MINPAIGHETPNGKNTCDSHLRSWLTFCAKSATTNPKTAKQLARIVQVSFVVGNHLLIHTAKAKTVKGASKITPLDPIQH